MNKNDFKELLKKCFGKEKNDRYHAVAMLTIYLVLFFIVVAFLKIAPTSTTNNDSNHSSNPSASSNPQIPVETNMPNIDQSEITNDINYSYSYTVKYNENTEVYLGKKIDYKEKFTLIKDNLTFEYAIINDNFLINDNGIYHITDKIDSFFKYCDVEKILSLIKKETPIIDQNISRYAVSNKKVANVYKESLHGYDDLENVISLTIVDNNILTGIDIDYSNYYSSVINEEVSLSIHMEFANVGTTEDFEIKLN